MCHVVPGPLYSSTSPPLSAEAKNSELDDEEVSQTLADDFVRAEFLRDRLVPKAVLFFTGEAVEEEEDEVRGQWVLRDYITVTS